MADELIRVEGLVKRYGGVAALDGVSLSVGEGEFVALLGPSGCGKTTLLRMIAGFIEPSEGEVWIDGRRANGTPPNQRPVNTVFQNYALFPHLTVIENVAFGPRRRGASRREAEELAAKSLATVGMEDFVARYPAQLSGGQQQRIALARAVVNRPKVLLLDEPLGALDLKLRKQMQLELKHLHERLGITFIYVTHDQEEALVMADRIAVMDKGRIAQIGTGETIYREPNSRYVADFIGEANLIDCVVAEGGGLRLKRGGVVLPYEVEAQAGAEAHLLVRPEDAFLDAAAGRDVVRLPAVVRDTVFVGDAIRVYLQLEGGEEIMARPSGGARPQKGEAVAVSWPRERARVLLG